MIALMQLTIRLQGFIKIMSDNFDKPLPIAIDKANSFSCNSYARGYHAYMKIWNAVDGAVLVRKRETDNPHDNYTVSIIRSSYVVGLRCFHHT